MQDEAIPRGLQTRGQEAAVLAVVLGVACVAYLGVLDGPKFRLDDAYIVLNNAAALFATDTAFPETPALHGSTSFLHTVAAALFGAVLSPETGLMVLAWMGLGLFGAGVLELARSAGLSLPMRALLAATAVTTGDLVQVHLNGLETGFAMATVTWLIVLHRRGSWSLPIVAGMAPFVRPELLLLSALIMVEALVRAGIQRDTRRLRGIVGRFACVFGALLTIQYLMSGSVLPSTGDAKRYFFVVSDLDARTELRIGLQQVALFLIQMLPLSVFLLAIVRRRCLPYALFALVLLGYFVIVQPLIMHQTYFRYLYVLIPLFFLGATDALSAPAQSLRLGAMAALVSAFAINLASAAETISTSIEAVRTKHAVLSEKAAWVERNVDPSEIVMIHDVGYLAYATDHRYSDMVGLKSPRAVEINERLSHRNGIDGRGRALVEIARASGAKTLLVSTNLDRVNKFTEAMRAQGWDLAAHPAGNPTEYEAYVMTPPQR